MKMRTILAYGFIILMITGCGTEFDTLKGKWIATIENQNIYQVAGNNENIGGKEDYILECDGKGNYTLILEDKKTKTGKYIIKKNNRITFKDDNNFLVGVCELSTDSEINCNETSTYAQKYTRYSK